MAKSQLDTFMSDFNSKVRSALSDLTVELDQQQIDSLVDEFEKFLRSSNEVRKSNKELLRVLTNLRLDLQSVKKISGNSFMHAAKGQVQKELVRAVNNDRSIFKTSAEINSLKLESLKLQKKIDNLNKKMEEATDSFKKLGSRLDNVGGSKRGKKGGKDSSIADSTSWIFSKNNSVDTIVKGMSKGVNSLIGFLSGRGFIRKLSGAMFDALAEANLVKHGLIDLFRLAALLIGNFVKDKVTGFLSRFMSPEAARKWGGVAGGTAFLGTGILGTMLKNGIPKGLKNLKGFNLINSTTGYKTMSTAVAKSSLGEGGIFIDEATGATKVLMKGKGGSLMAQNAESMIAKGWMAKNATKLTGATKISKGLGPLGIAISAAAEIPALFKAKKEGRFGAQLAESGGGVGGAIVGGMVGALGGPIGVMVGAALGDWIGRTIGKGFGKFTGPIGENFKKYFQNLGRIIKSMGPLFTLLGKIIKVGLTPVRLTFMALTPVLKGVGMGLGWIVKLFSGIAVTVTKWLAPAFEKLGKWIDGLNKAIDAFMEAHPILAQMLGLEPKESTGPSGASPSDPSIPGDTSTSGYKKSIFKGETFDDKRITSKYGEVSGVHKTGHHGVDLAYKAGEKVGAKIGGKVLYTGYDKNGYGNFAVIEDKNGYKHYYGHMESMGVKAGQTIKAGGTIGIAGSTGHSTGVHLHYEVRKPGQKNYLAKASGYDVDPLAYVEEFRKAEKASGAIPTVASKKKGLTEFDNMKEEQAEKMASLGLGTAPLNKVINEASKVGSAGTPSAAGTATANQQFDASTVRGRMLGVNFYNTTL